MTDTSNQKGSKLRCSMFSLLGVETIQAKLQAMVQRAGISDLTLELEDKCKYYPQVDFGIPEYRFSDKNGLVDETLRKKLIKWWLGIDGDTNRNTPNWDFACDAIINGEKGLILIEAKSYKEELIRKDPWGATSEQSKQIISKALTEANEHLNTIHQGFNLNWDTNYQISNRFAWSWKLAVEGIPVVLIYLGFLNCEEMIANTRSILKTSEDWNLLFKDDLKDVIPYSVWNKPINIGKSSFFPIIATEVL